MHFRVHTANTGLPPIVLLLHFRNPKTASFILAVFLLETKLNSICYLVIRQGLKNQNINLISNLLCVFLWSIGRLSSLSS